MIIIFFIKIYNSYNYFRFAFSFYYIAVCMRSRLCYVCVCGFSLLYFSLLLFIIIMLKEFNIYNKKTKKIREKRTFITFFFAKLFSIKIRKCKKSDSFFFLSLSKNINICGSRYINLYLDANMRQKHL